MEKLPKGSRKAQKIKFTWIKPRMAKIFFQKETPVIKVSI
jgi:hypothetical protein